MQEREEQQEYIQRAEERFGDIRIELYVGEPYRNESNNICIPLLRRIYLFKRKGSKASKKVLVQ